MYEMEICGPEGAVAPDGWMDGWISRMKPAGGKLKYLEKNVAQCHVNHHKYFMDWSRIEPRSLRWEAVVAKDSFMMIVVLKIRLNYCKFKYMCQIYASFLQVATF